MRYDFIVFGGTGLQGKICAKDLLENGYSALLVGRDLFHIKDLLKYEKIGFMKVNLNNQKEIVNAIKKSRADVVVNCAELIFNISIMKACLETKKSLIDLGGSQKITLQQFKLHKLFKKSGILNLTGCGSTPGISNIMASYAVKDLDSVYSIDLGFVWDSSIKKFVVPYSIPSIFYEFTEPPIVYFDGKFKRSDRMICTGTYSFKEIGKQTTYCIDHSEVYTFYKYFKDKGLKAVHYMAGFPEHSINVIKMLINLGFNSKEEIEINNVKISPLDFTTKILKKIKMPDGYKEIENIWVKVKGEKNNKKVNRELNCIVKTLKGWEEAGSNVDTGRTISIISQMIKNGLIKETGVYAPEAVVPHKEFFKQLSRREMYVYMNGKRVN